MPEHLKALAYILVMATAVFAFAKASACATATAPADFERRRNLWFGITLVAFLAHEFWIYIVVTGVLLLVAQQREHNKLATYFFVLLAVPHITAKVPGMGVVNYLFEIDYLRLLALTVLLPAYLSLRKEPGVEPFGRSVPDKLLAIYLILTPVIMLQYAPFTAILRHGVFYAFIDVFLPYYVASRSLRNLQDFRDALMAFAVAALVLSATLVFEFAYSWLLYSSLDRAMGVNWAWGHYLRRGASLRASGTVGHAIAAGYVIAVAAAFFVYLRKVVPNPAVWRLGLALLAAGLIAPLSRGPWVGAALMLVVFIATGPTPLRSLVGLGALGGIGLPLLLLSPVGTSVIDHLPFIGTVDATTIAFRQRLAEVSFQVFLENPVFGRYDSIETPAMQSLRGNDGVIDVVNTYVAIGLGSGLVGLSAFIGCFVAVMFGIHKGMRSIADKHDEHYLLGRVLISAILGIMAIIATVSPVLIIPALYWTVAGLGVAYGRMLAPARAPAATNTAGLRTGKLGI